MSQWRQCWSENHTKSDIRRLLLCTSLYSTTIESARAIDLPTAVPFDKALSALCTRHLLPSISSRKFSGLKANEWMSEVNWKRDPTSSTQRTRPPLSPHHQPRTIQSHEALESHSLQNHTNAGGRHGMLRQKTEANGSSKARRGRNGEQRPELELRLPV